MSDTVESVKKNFQKFLFQLEKKAGSRRELARQIKMSHGSIVRWEQGSSPGLDHLAQLCAVYKLSMRDLGTILDGGVNGMCLSAIVKKQIEIIGREKFEEDTRVKGELLNRIIEGEIPDRITLLKLTAALPFSMRQLVEMCDSQ